MLLKTLHFIITPCITIAAISWSCIDVGVGVGVCIVIGSGIGISIGWASCRQLAEARSVLFFRQTLYKREFGEI